MSKTRVSQSSKGRVADKNIQKQITQLQNQMDNAENVDSDFIRERAKEVKVLLKTLLDKADDVPNRYKLLDQLSKVRSQLTDMNKAIKKKREGAKTPISTKKFQNRSVSSSRVSRVSKASKVSKKSQVSQKSKKSKKSKLRDQTQETPQFPKKPFKNKLGSFAKSIKQKRSLSNSASSKKKPTKHKTEHSSRMNRRTESSGRVKNIQFSESSSISSQKKRVSYKDDFTPDSSSITLSSDMKQAVRGRTNLLSSKYENLVDDEKKTKEIDVGQLSREENLLLTTKMESITKEKLLREYRILFYRSKEIRKLLSEYYDQNIQLNEIIEDQKNELRDAQDVIRKLKKENKNQSREVKEIQNEFDVKLEQLTRQFQQQYQSSVPIGDFDHLKMDNEKILIENTVIKEENKLLQQKLIQYEQEISQRRRGDYNDQYQDNTVRLQRELENQREQYDRLREENLRSKVLLDKEQLTNRELTFQLSQKSSQIDGTLEQKHYEIVQLKQQLQSSQSKISKLEQQLSQQNQQLMTEYMKSLQNEYNQKIDMMTKTFQQSQESHNLPQSEIEQVKIQNDKLQLDNSILREELKMLNNKLQQLDIENQSRRKYEFNEYYQENKKEQDQLREQLDKLKDDNLQKQCEINSLKNEQSNNLNKIQELFQENTLLQNEQEQCNKKKDKIKRLEEEIRLLGLKLENREKELESIHKSEINEYRLQQDKLLIKHDQISVKLQDLQTKYQRLQDDYDNQQKRYEQVKNEKQELQKELDQIDRVKENYKNKYLNNRYETRKIINQLSEKENQLKQTYSNELERVKSEKDQLVKVKQEEEQQRNQRDKKLKVINDLQQMIKGHRKAFDPK